MISKRQGVDKPNPNMTWISTIARVLKPHTLKGQSHNVKEHT